MAKPVFKKYEQQQNFLLPPSLDELIEANHPVRIVNKVINSIEIYWKRRPVDVEPVFGNIKSNHGFRRLMLRGKEKVAIEVGLLALVQNLRKKAA